MEAFVDKHLAEQQAEIEKHIDEIKHGMNASFPVPQETSRNQLLSNLLWYGEEMHAYHADLIDGLLHLGPLLGQVLADESLHLGLSKASLLLRNLGRREPRKPSQINGSSRMNGSFH